MNPTGATRAIVILATATLVLIGCASTTDDSGFDTGVSMPSAFRLVLDHADAPTDDTIEVSVCEVPLPTSDPIYGDLPLRLRLDPAAIADQMETGVRPYFEAISHGRYRPRFTAGTVFPMTADETHGECVERALDASSSDATTVMVVATAEDIATESGGWGWPGSPCDEARCPAATTRRALYVGASDFYDPASPGEATATPLLDLIEHEIGHTLDLPHSGDGDQQYTSALDMMSNSAAPRDVQADRIHAQDTLAINRLALGWLPESAVAVVDADGGSFELWPSTGETGQRLLIVPIDDAQFLTVELLSATGYNDFLPHAGIAVHRVEPLPDSCTGSSADTPCTGIDRLQTVVGDDASPADLLGRGGDKFTVDGWTIELRHGLTGAVTTAEVEVRPTER